MKIILFLLLLIFFIDSTAQVIVPGAVITELKGDRTFTSYARAMMNISNQIN
jgi:hypothetical protein